MTIYSAIALAGATFLLGITPGLGVFATISRAIASGFANALFVVAGIVIGDVVYLLVAIYGLGFIATTMGELFGLIKYIGGAYLIYLGYKIYTNEVSSANILKVPKLSWRTNFSSGLLITLGNPKVIVFYLSFLPAFMELETLSSADIVATVLIVSATLSCVLSSYAYMASKAKEIFKSSSAMTRLNKISGVAMVGAGTMLILKS